MLRRRQFLTAASLGFSSVATTVEAFAPPTSTATVNVRNFGATGDGNTDDSAAVKRALDSSFRKLHFPPGRYNINNVRLGVQKNVVLDASEATLVNDSSGAPMFRLPLGDRLARSRLSVGDYITGDRGGVFLDIAGGLVVDSRIDIDRVRITNPAGGVIRHHSRKREKKVTEGLYFTTVTGMRWDSASKTASLPMIDVSSGYNSFSACNFTVRDVRLLSGALFFKALCYSRQGSSFLQLKLHDMSVEKCFGGFAHIEGARMSGLENIGMYDLKSNYLAEPLIVVKHSEAHKNAGGCYCRDIFRARARFLDAGCDLMYDKDVLMVSNYHGIGGLVTKSP